jgi:hypothetical protein
VFGSRASLYVNTASRVGERANIRSRTGRARGAPHTARPAEAEAPRARAPIPLRCTSVADRALPLRRRPASAGATVTAASLDTPAESSASRWATRMGCAAERTAEHKALTYRDCESQGIVPAYRVPPRGKWATKRRRNSISHIRAIAFPTANLVTSRNRHMFDCCVHVRPIRYRPLDKWSERKGRPVHERGTPVASLVTGRDTQEERQSMAVRRISSPRQNSRSRRRQTSVCSRRARAVRPAAAAGPRTADLPQPDVSPTQRSRATQDPRPRSVSHQ